MLLAPAQTSPLVQPDVTGSESIAPATSPLSTYKNPYPINTASDTIIPGTVAPVITMQQAASPVLTIPAIVTQAPQVNIFQAATTTKASNVIYAQGYINDGTTKKAIPASIQLVTIATGQPLAGDTPLLLQDGFYSAWTDQGPGIIGIKFTAPGYTDKIISISDLQNSPDVYLDKKSNTLPLLLGAGLLLVLANKKGKKVGAAPLITTGTLVTIGVGFMILKGMGLLNDLLKKLGLGPDPTVAAQTDPHSPWKPGYWQTFSNYPNGAITEDTAKTLGETIHSAFTLFEDDYNAIYGAISTLKSKAQVSFLAWEFQKQYDEDLLTFLTNGGGIMPWDGLSSTHLQTLVTLVNNLPAS